MTWSERLTGLDATFLYLEDRTAHMHVGSVAVFAGPPPSYPELVALIASRLPDLPRYRQRLAFVPFDQGRPVWVDDAHFDVEYHVRHTALPPPGGEDQLKKLAGRLFGQRLDRGKPLWELWFVEGLGDQRFAIITKTHHCMIDGISGVDIATVLLDSESSRPKAESSQEGREASAAPPWIPRPAPSQSALIASALREQLTNPVELVRGALRQDSEARRAIGELAAGLKPLLGMARMGSAPDTSLNAPIGPHRRFETARLSLATIRRVRSALGGTVNDVILAAVAGALRSLFVARGETPPSEVRVLVPVSVRSPEQRGRLGNQVAAIFCPLPVGEADPRARLERVRAEMQGLKESKQAVGAMALTRLGDFTPPTLAAQAARLQTMTKFFNLVVTNVPGPQVPLYLLGREMLAPYPCVPLAANQTVGIALLSYNGAIYVGVLGDADQARDLDRLGAAIPAALDELIACAEAQAARSAAPSA